MSRPAFKQELRALWTVYELQNEGWSVAIRGRRRQYGIYKIVALRYIGKRQAKHSWKGKRRSQYRTQVEGKIRKKWLLGFGPDPPVFKGWDEVWCWDEIVAMG